MREPDVDRLCRRPSRWEWAARRWSTAAATDAPPSSDTAPRLPAALTGTDATGATDERMFSMEGYSMEGYSMIAFILLVVVVVIVWGTMRKHIQTPVSAPRCTLRYWWACTMEVRTMAWGTRLIRYIARLIARITRFITFASILLCKHMFPTPSFSDFQKKVYDWNNNFTWAMQNYIWR